MVRRRFFSAVSNHEATRGCILRDAAKRPLLRMRQTRWIVWGLKFKLDPQPLDLVRPPRERDVFGFHVEIERIVAAVAADAT
jgi:hypothetical protein